MEVICPLANGNGVAYFLAGKFEIRTPMQLKVHASGSCLMVFLLFCHSGVLKNQKPWLKRHQGTLWVTVRKIHNFERSPIFFYQILAFAEPENSDNSQNNRPTTIKFHHNTSLHYGTMYTKFPVASPNGLINVPMTSDLCPLCICDHQQPQTNCKKPGKTCANALLQAVQWSACD